MAGIPSASGARLSGDDYQHTFTWLYALKLLHEFSGVTRIEFEAADAGNVDDLIVHRRDAPTIYHQVKFVQVHQEPLSYEWFITPPPRLKQSPLQRFYESYRKLTRNGQPPEMALQTNRLPALRDPILKHLSGRNHKLVPRLADKTRRSASGRARAAWAENLKVGESELLEMLEHFEIHAGRGSLEVLQEECSYLMAAVGLRPDVAAVRIGVSEIRRLIGEGVRELDVEMLQEIIDAQKLADDTKRATLLVQALERDPWPETATAAVDWVDMFEGEEASVRRRLRDERGWNEVMRPQLREAVAEIKRQGYRDVLVTGTMRLSTGFMVGFELPDVAGFEIAVRQRGEEWSSASQRTDVDVARQEVELNQGDEIAIGISVAVHVATDVIAYIKGEGLSVGRFVNLMPERGIGGEVLADAAEARGLARKLLDAARAETAGGSKVHLFQATPLGLALILGHIWNRMPETQLYDDLGAGRGYTPTFRLAG